ncbi:glycerol-3-phosphate responsive antiterminator [Sporosarcina koreensis]|uniref:glycerol-3-phosphate responsive antiterminator n=1 Tax=Sporosarcina koreensis TaxID=334735 RepID=UPI00058BEC51|nr:glycerol-3-phosphate responsive antiterminator [Sporosarcina koreensis]
MNFIDMVESQMIASVHTEKSLEQALTSNVNIVFLLTGDLLTAGIYIERLQNAGKRVFLHLDFIDGLANSKSAISFVKETWGPTGIITTKSHLIKYASDMGLMTIQRIFLLDGSAVTKGIEMVNSSKPDAIEIMPGVITKVIDQLSSTLDFPVIAGGLITEASEVYEALRCGALAVSSGNPEMWELDL